MGRVCVQFRFCARLDALCSCKMLGRPSLLSKFSVEAMGNKKGEYFLYYPH